MNTTSIPWVGLMLLVLAQNPSLAGDPAKPVRIASGAKGHIHPAVCVTKKGTVVVIFSQSDMKDLRVTRSSDSGATWTKPEPFAPTVNVSIYPGSLTALADGRIVHAWNVWYTDDAKKKSRYVQYSISNDEGKTWSEPASLPKNPKAESIIRHPFIEIGPKEWLFPLSDGRLSHNPSKGENVVPIGDTKSLGLVPLVRTAKGTFVSGSGHRSTDETKSWQKIELFPKIAAQGWRHEMVGLSNGWIIASDIDGDGIGGGTRLHFVISQDDGKTWDFKNTLEYYNPGRAIAGRACPRTIELDAKTLGTVFYDGSDVFFLRTPIARFK